MSGHLLPSNAFSPSRGNTVAFRVCEGCRLQERGVCRMQMHKNLATVFRCAHETHSRVIAAEEK